MNEDLLILDPSGDILSAAILNVPELTDLTQPYIFTVTYTDNELIKVSTIDLTDVSVTAPDGTTDLPVTFLGEEDLNGDQSVIVATYSVVPPGGNWANARGSYRVAINLSQEETSTDNQETASILGDFNINLPPQSLAPTGVIRIEAEDYKAGVNEVTYFDDEAENLGGAYRLNEPVDVQVTGDVDGGFNVGWIQAGEFLTYDVDIPQAGNYELTLRVASPSTDVQNLDVVVGGQTYTANFGSTGEWQAYQDVVLPNVTLEAGIQELRLNMQSSDFNLNYIQLEAKAPIVDQTAPVAQVDTTTLTQQANSPAAAIFTVTYTDDLALNTSITDSSNVEVTSPDGKALPVTFVGVDAIGNGTSLTATYAIAAPGGTWVNTDQGDYTVTVKAGAVSDTSDNAIAPGTVGSFSIDVTEEALITGDPVGNGDINIIRIEAEDYKSGSNGLGYFDTSRGNFGGKHRLGDVDIEATSDLDGEYNLAWIESGEYLTYDVNPSTAGNYDLVLRVATPGTDTKEVEVVVGGTAYTASFSNTGGWNVYQDVVINNVSLSAGAQEIVLNMKSGGFNLNYFQLVEQPQVNPPSGIIRIEAEDYLAGTNNVEYFDTEPENLGGAYRPGEAVDIQVTEDQGGGFNVAWIESGEYLTYALNLPTSGKYDVVLRVATPFADTKEIELLLGGKTYTATFSNTGGWQTYTDVVISGVDLAPGGQQLRLDAKIGQFNLNYIELLPHKPVVDQTAPTANLQTTSVAELAGTSNTADFSVTFTDNIAIDLATIDSNDLIVTAPNGEVLPVTLISTDSNASNKSVTANYSLTAPAGTWQIANQGNYTVTLQAGQLGDTSGNTAVANTLGSFNLDITNPASDQVIRINAGASNNLLDSANKLWLADNYFLGGQAISAVANPIANTEDDFIYQAQRSGNDFSYSIPVDNGNYLVSLHLAETDFNTPGSRQFDVTLEGDLVFDNLDIYQETNNAFLDGTNTAKIIELPAIGLVRDGTLNLDFDAVLADATLAGIEIAAIEDPQVLIQESDQNTSVTEGGNTDTYQVLLNTQPTANVTIDLQLDGQVTADQTSLVFTPQNWSAPQTVTVSALDDTVAESFHSSTIGHTISTNDAVYSNLNVASVALDIVDNDLVEVKFDQKTVANIGAPTVGAWGPDGRLYVGTYLGEIKAYSFDDNYNVTAEQTITTLTGLSNNNITGIAFNPFENDGSQPKIYVSHNQFFANDGAFDILTEFSPYSGQVSVLEGPDFSQLQPLVQNIGVSNHDHGVNGLAFDDQGDLLITVGSNTNAGIADDALGGIDESPFTAAILKAEITKDNFNGNIQYQLPDDWQAPEGLTLTNPEESQGFGGVVDVVDGVDVSVYASGFRNAFDLVYSTKGIIYATENGANQGFGDVSTSATDQEAFTLNVPDELNIVEPDGYYGSPNRNRGRYDSRQNTYYSPDDPSSADHIAPIADFEASTNGIIEYRSAAFDSQLRGNLLAQQWNGTLYNVELSKDGTEVLNVGSLETEVGSGQPVATGLDVLTAPGGAIISIDLNDNAITVATPDDELVTAMIAYDISTWRAPASGGGQFIIGGVNFSDVTDTVVTIGDEVATITSVSDQRIIGTLPSFNPSGDDLLDVVVESNSQVSTITDAFQPLFV